MMIKFHVLTKSILTFFRTVSVYQILILNVESFNFKCPSQTHWKLRAQVKCNSTLTYYCLYNNIKGKYVEGCNGPDWDRKGSKRIYAGDFTRGDCMEKRFQPFKFWTNGSMSDCIYAKIVCSEDGQIIYKDDSRKDDRTCRCDYKRNYSFVKTPRNGCFCIPTEEDCSCHFKSCPINLTLSSDYECTNKSLTGKPKCIDINRFPETFDGQKRVLMIKWEAFNDKWKNSTTVIILVLLCLVYIIVISGFFFEIFPNWSCWKLKLSKLHIYNLQDTGWYTVKKDNSEEVHQLTQPDFGEASYVQTGLDSMDNLDGRNQGSCEITSDIDDSNETQELINAEVHQQIQLVKPTPDEVNLLRIVHLLYRVACPVVRMTFNHEIQPNQLRKTLYNKKKLLEKRYRRKDKIINDFHWDILFTKGKTVTSEDFDIELMMNLMETLAGKTIGTLYPVESDTKESAMLTRIKYIINETTQLFEGKLSKDDFSQYWDDIGQAVLKLMSLHKFDIANDQEKVRLLGRLFALSPITIENNKLCLFIDMSETYPTMILQKLITEYCTLKSESIQDVLSKEKHQLFHKRNKTESCCQCTKGYETFIKVIPENLWEALYEVDDNYDLCSPTCSLGNCCKRCVPKKSINIDLLVAKVLILNIQNILFYMISRLCASGFDTFLMQNQHTIYHSMRNNVCCKCNNTPSEIILINEREWNSLFMKHVKGTTCQINSKDCCCQYLVKKDIKYSEIDGTLLTKIFHVACPVLNKIEKDAFIYFLNWTVDDKPLEKALKELLNVIEDKTFCSRISSCIPSQSDITKEKQIHARNWVSRHLRQQRATPEQQLEILLRDADGLNVKIVQIPKDFPLPKRTFCSKKFTDLTTEENNFLVVVYALTNIVYPVVKEEFNTKCPDLVLNKIRMELYEQQQPQHSIDENTSKQNRIHLTQNQQKQLFPRKSQESKNLDLKLMIYILKRTTENVGNTDYVDELDVINEIQREIIQSSSGVLNNERFKEILGRTHKAVLRLGGSWCEERLLNLQYIRNILE